MGLMGFRVRSFTAIREVLGVHGDGGTSKIQLKLGSIEAETERTYVSSVVRVIADVPDVLVRGTVEPKFA